MISTVNTYLWIIATAISKPIRTSNTKENMFSTVIVLLVKAIRICPAVIFAASRTDRVKGRIIWLTVSINTINWDKGRGVLKGTRCLKKWFVFFLNLKITNPNHNGKAKLKVKDIWAVIVKT